MTPSKTYDNIFPNLQLRYNVTPKFVIRGVYSTSLARPGFTQTTQKANISTDPAVLSISTGNPNLVPTYSHNFDLSFEYYLPNSGIISIGFYDKEIKNFIVARSLKQQATFGGITGLYTFTTYSNVTGTYDRGIEASYVQRFAGLPTPFDGLGVDLNANYNKSSVSLHDGQPAQSIPGSAEFTGNAALFYEAHKIRTRLSLKYDGRTVIGINGSGSQTYTAFGGVGPFGTDVYLDKRITLDWTGAYDFTKNVSLFASVKNITDAPLRYYEGTPNRPTQREFYGATYEAGIKVKL